MSNLKFADTHNLLAFLSKPAESEGFEQIVDFLNALTVNPTIYTSCIDQFWATVKVKTVNGEVQLHALVDRKKIIINESTVRRDLQLEDAEGIDCLPNSTIFKELTRMGSKTTAWNEFSSIMESAIICLATNQKFNFSKHIFESMVRNLDNVSGKFLMYPRFVQVFVNQQLDGLPSHKRIYDAPSHTKKIFGNMKRVPQPSGPTDIVANEVVHKELGDSLVRAATTASSLEVEQDSGGGPRRQETIGDTIAQTRFENVSKLSNDPLLAKGNTLQSGEDSLKLKELMKLCTNLQQRVLDLDKTKTTQQNEIASLKRRLKKLKQKKRLRTHGLKRLHKVGMSRRVESSRDEDSLEQEVAAKDVNLTINEVTLAQSLVALKSVKPKVKGVVIQEPSTTKTTISSQQPSHDKGKGIMIEELMKPIKKKDQISFDEEVALRLQTEFDKEERLAR
ncbi:hypothetical protein Tco_0988610 [Tanacetum coccineum]|uniref:Uncharacterized protein n=1 Tax=Tanacetum coccineum TaxID=301880 RepID=A0ABQ5ERE0_9ASTR